MTGDWLEQFEVRLDALARCCRERDATLARVLAAAQQAFATLATDVDVDVCLIEESKLEVLGTTQNARPDYGDSLLQRIRSMSMRDGDAECVDESPLMCVQHLADQQEVICLFHYTHLNAPAVSCRDAVQTISDLVGQAVGKHLLARIAVAVRISEQLASLATAVASCADFSAAAAIVATDGANILSDCRISVLQRRRESFDVAAVTGVVSHSLSSETVTALSQLAANGRSDLTSLDWAPIAPDAEETAPLKRSGVERYAVVCDNEEAGVCLVVESFSGVPAPSTDVLRRFCATALPALNRFPRRRRALRSGRGVWMRNALLTATVALLLAVIPMDFEVEVEGRIQPTKWNRVFAPDNGAIKEVMFENESVVVRDQPLFLITNPDYDQELSKVLGEIQTTLAELASAKTRRLTGNDPDASADEQRLTARLTSLESTRDLLQSEIDGLTIVAPYDGTVFLQDAREEMMTRPVHRGQSLLRIAAADTDWQLELDIPDHLRGYVARQFEHRKQLRQSVGVEYLIRSSAAGPQQTELDSLNGSMELADGMLICRGTAAATELSLQDQRPGTSVVARISCGRRSVGFVWFREVIELCRHLKFAWF